MLTNLIRCFIVISIFFTGCGHRLFHEVKLVSVQDVDPEKVINDFSKALPKEFTIIDAIVFKYRGRAITGIGYTKINREKNDFKTVCLNPAGVKIFEIQGSAKENKTNFMLDKFDALGDAGMKIAEDIRRIYFQIVPLGHAKIIKKEKTIIFRQKKDSGHLEYVFGGVDNLLIRKKYYQKEKLIWTVSYYRWEKHQEKIYPEKVVFKNHKYNYQLVSHLKEVRL